MNDDDYTFAKAHQQLFESPEYQDHQQSLDELLLEILDDVGAYGGLLLIRESLKRVNALEFLIDLNAKGPEQFHADLVHGA